MSGRGPRVPQMNLDKHRKKGIQICISSISGSGAKTPQMNLNKHRTMWT